MENALWKVFAFILCAVLLFLVPLMSLLERQDDIAYTVVLAECNRFADACRDTGYITPGMYSEFQKRLLTTGNTYNIKMSHIKRSVIPVYKETDHGEELIFTEQYEIIHTSFSEEDILSILFPRQDIPLEDRRYNMGAGDLFFVEVANKGKTMAAAIRDMIFFSDTKAPGIFVRTGGMVRNEAY
jgi:hypothetical protein